MPENKSQYLTNFKKVHIKTINRFILTQLKKHKGFESKISIEISENLKNFLIKSYDLSESRFRVCHSFLKDFRLIKRVYLNNNNYNFIRREDFFLQITRPKFVQYKQKNKAKSMKTNPSISIKFFRSNEVSLNKSQLIFIKNLNKTNSS